MRWTMDAYRRTSAQGSTRPLWPRRERFAAHDTFLSHRRRCQFHRRRPMPQYRHWTHRVLSSPSPSKQYVPMRATITVPFESSKAFQHPAPIYADTAPRSPKCRHGSSNSPSVTRATLWLLNGGLRSFESRLRGLTGGSHDAHGRASADWLASHDKRKRPCGDVPQGRFRPVILVGLTVHARCDCR